MRSDSIICAFFISRLSSFVYFFFFTLLLKILSFERERKIESVRAKIALQSLRSCSRSYSSCATRHLDSGKILTTAKKTENAK